MNRTRSIDKQRGTAIPCKIQVLLAALLLCLASGLAIAQDTGGGKTESSWLGLSADERDAVESYASAYKAFMADAKTELMFVAETISRAEAAGFEPLRADSELTPGARFYDNNRDRALALIVVGSDDMQDGFRIVGAHIDSPRIELKGRPLYGKEGFALFQTNYHGGIKNYQWTSIPLALVGRIDKKDGTTINVSVGNKPGEPVFIIPELSPHVDVSLRERKSREVIAPEELDPDSRLVVALPRRDDALGPRDPTDGFDLSPIRQLHFDEDPTSRRQGLARLDERPPARHVRAGLLGCAEERPSGPGISLGFDGG